VKSQILQEVIIWVLLIAAVIFLGRHIYGILAHKKKAGCADCGKSENLKIWRLANLKMGWFKHN